MYESGLSKGARIIFLIMAVLLGVLFIMSSGCSCANAKEVKILSDSGVHSFF